MNQEQINKEIFERLNKLEQAVFDVDRIKKPTQTVKRKNKAEDLKVPIAKLFDSSFFKEPKIDMEVFFE